MGKGWRCIATPVAAFQGLGIGQRLPLAVEDGPPVLLEDQVVAGIGRVLPQIRAELPVKGTSQEQAVKERQNQEGAAHHPSPPLLSPATRPSIPNCATREIGSAAGRGGGERGGCGEGRR